jgi:hypothetical protein
MTAPTPLPIQPPAPIPAVPLPLPVPPPIPGPPIAPMPIADVEIADIIEALTDMLKARDALIEAAVRQMREERDAAVEALTLMLTDLRSDNAVMAARLDRIDPPDELPGYVSVKRAAGACGYSGEAVRRWAATGQVTAVKRGGRVRVELQSVLERAGRRG